MEPKARPILKLKIPQQVPLLSDFDLEANQTVICDGACTAPVVAIPPFQQQHLRFDLSRTRSFSTSRHPPAFDALSRALSRTLTLSSLRATSISVEEWRRVFDRLDVESDGKSDGKIPVLRFKEILEENPMWDSVPLNIQDNILFKIANSEKKFLDFESFLDIIKGSQSDGFNVWQRRAFREYVKQTVKYLLPYNFQYQNQYTCFPPPIFMLLISLLQLAVFTYNSVRLSDSSMDFQAACSVFIFHPVRRSEIWRYVSYMLVHSDSHHILFNVLAQLVLGVPLEMVHGWWRVMCVYLSGVLAGSLWTNVFFPHVFLSGASSGVYPLITAHLATVIMNYREMSYPWSRLILVSVVGVSEIIMYFFRDSGFLSQQPVSYPAHIAGASIGLFAGITCLKNLRWEKFEIYLWFFSAVSVLLILGIPTVFSLANRQYFETHIENSKFLHSKYAFNCSVENFIF